MTPYCYFLTFVNIMCRKWFTKNLDIISTRILLITGFAYFYFYVRRIIYGQHSFNVFDNDRRGVLVNYNRYFTKVPSFESTNKIEEHEPVDVVYTWVDGSDQRFKHDLETFLKSQGRNDADVLALNRFSDFGLLKYSLRSIEQNAKWIRNIFLVTNGQVPDWLELDNPRLTVVKHEEIFQNKRDLPTFSAQAVECHIHRIKGLSKRFIYMYDDVIFTYKVVLDDFVTQSGRFKVRFNIKSLKGCNRGCRAENVNNGNCEQECYTKSCEWDGDDCIGIDIEPYTESDKNYTLDSWRGSILHTNFLYNKYFGPRKRHIPKIGPHLFDKDIFHDLSERFPDEWNRTSSQKIRHHLSVNMQFAYYNFLVEADMMGASGIKIDLTYPPECCETEVLEIHNGQFALWKQHLWNTDKKITQDLKNPPKFFIVTSAFTKPLSNLGKIGIENELEDFFEKMFPQPSRFEI